jgi:hypothetical protein
MDYTNLEDLKVPFPTNWMNMGMAGAVMGEQQANYRTDRNLHEYLNQLNAQEKTQQTKEFLTSAPTRLAQQVLARQEAEAKGQTLPSQVGAQIAQNQAISTVAPAKATADVAAEAHKVEEIKKTHAWEKIQAAAPYTQGFAQIDQDTDTTPEQKQRNADALAEQFKMHFKEAFPDDDIHDKFTSTSDVKKFVMHSNTLAQYDAQQQNKERLAQINKVDPAQIAAASRQNVAGIQADARVKAAQAQANARTQAATIMSANRQSMGTTVQNAVNDTANMHIQEGMDPTHARAVANQEILGALHSNAAAFSEDKAAFDYAAKFLEKNYDFQQLMSGKPMDAGDAAQVLNKMREIMKEYHQTGGKGNVSTPQPIQPTVPMAPPTALPPGPPSGGGMADQIPGQTSTGATDYQLPQNSSGPQEAAAKAANWKGPNGEIADADAKQMLGKGYDPAYKYRIGPDGKIQRAKK